MIWHLAHVFLVASAPADSVGLDLSTYGSTAQSSGTLVLSPVLHGEVAASERWSVTADWGFVYARELSDEEGHGRFLLGNPAVGARYRLPWLGERIRVGMGGSLPFARLEDDVDGRRHTRNALAYATGMRANYDLWLWAPERGSVFVPADVLWVLAHGWIGAEVAAALLIPMGGFANGRVDVALQSAVTVAYSAPVVDLGMRWQVVAVATQPRERFQWAMAPFVAANLGPTRVGLEAVVPLGDPLAAFNLWSLQAGVEVSL